MGLTPNQAKRILKYIECLRDLADVYTTPDDDFLKEALEELKREEGEFLP